MALFIGESIFLSPDVTAPHRASLPARLMSMIEHGAAAPPFVLEEGPDAADPASAYLDLLDCELALLEDRLLAVAAIAGDGPPGPVLPDAGVFAGNFDALWVLHIWANDLDLAAQLNDEFEEVATRARRVVARFQIAAATVDLLNSIALDAARYDVRMAA